MKKQTLLPIAAFFSLFIALSLISCNPQNHGGGTGGQASDIKFASLYMTGSAFLNIWPPYSNKIPVSFRFNFNDTGITLHGWSGERGSYKPKHDVDTYVADSPASVKFDSSYYLGTLRLDTIYIDSVIRILKSYSNIDSVVVLFVPLVSSSDLKGGSGGYPPYKYAHHVYYDIYIGDISNGDKVKQKQERPLIVTTMNTGLSLNPSPPANQ
jgi:hypothetical protein